MITANQMKDRIENELGIPVQHVKREVSGKSEFYTVTMPAGCTPAVLTRVKEFVKSHPDCIGCDVVRGWV